MTVASNSTKVGEGHHRIVRKSRTLSVRFAARNSSRRHTRYSFMAEPLPVEICLSYGFPGDQRKKVQVRLPLSYLPQVYGMPHVLPGASAELRDLLA